MSLTDYELEVIKQLHAQNTVLGDIKAQGSATAQAVMDLAGPQGRVTKIENDLSWENKKSWIKSAVVVPITLALNYLGHRLLGVR